MEALLQKLAACHLCDGSDIILEKTDDITITVSVNAFETMFGEALGSENPYRALCDADKNDNGTEKGYKKYFDIWKDMEILTEE